MKLDGKFGRFGGLFVPELLIPALEELEDAFLTFRDDKDFNLELSQLLKDYAGRPTALYHAKRISSEVGTKVYFKREDLLHGGAHKTNNTIGQALLAKKMGKTKLIAETGAGQHGVATALVGAMLNMEVEIFMGAKDVERQRPNVQRMELFGAKVRPISAGSASLKDAINDTMRYWTANVRDCFYVFGTVAGPHPYPTIVRDFQRIIGDEARAELLEREKQLPTKVVACVGGGSNAMGLFAAFIDDPDVAIIGIEPGGHGILSGAHGATLSAGTVGCLHGSISYVLQSKDGQINEAHSVSAGLDYPGVGPEHAWLKDSGRATYLPVDDERALEAFSWLSRTEGIIPALETSHAIAAIPDLAKDMSEEDILLINLSGRGDKDLDHVMNIIGAQKE
ncbi:MAG: tryptophan synthase subunit beta [Myxococcota bacterium]|nr:tryptophan synthase subunit beta [Myxococcota bacterium]